LLESREILQEHEVRYFGRQLVAGVLHLHGLKLLHGDLKPTNMMMTKEVVLKVGDFGQAEDMGEEKESWSW
jgi:serine/threonine protein kinase